MRTLYPVALAAFVVSCHLDKLLNGGGGNGPPSEAAPVRVAFSSSLSNPRAGQPISPPVQVTVQDSAGRVTLRDTLVTLSLAANPSGDSLRGTKQVRSVNGVATFADLRLDKAASGYTLTAAAPELHPDTSTAFSVMPAPATVLAFTGQPSVTTQDSAMKPVQVTAYDSLGNTATNFAGSIRLQIGTDGSVSKKAGLAGGVASAVAGVATFPNLRIDSVGTGYTLTAAFGSAAPVDTSLPFDIIAGPPPPPPPPTHLGFTQQPQPTEAGATITPPVQVAALDASEHVVQGFTGTIGLALEPASNGGTLSGGTPINAVNGIATFPSLSVDKASTGYTLRATASGLTDATSSAFNITPPPNQSPVAAFTSSCPTLTCSFTDQSSDPDGTIASWQWTFGDGTTGSTAQNPSHTYSAAGSYTVTLTVKDNQNASSSPVSHTVQVTAPNQPPSAAFTSSCPTLTCSFTDQSSDPDGTIATWRWDFGDGSAAGTTRNPSHTYSAGGSYTVTLTVTDNQGAQNSVTHPVAPSQPNQPPSVTAGGEQTVLIGALFSLSGAGFSDPDHDGPWTVTIDWGDGTSSTSTASSEGSIGGSHSYPVTLLGRDYQLTVTVVDAHGARGSATKTVHVVVL